MDGAEDESDQQGECCPRGLCLARGEALPRVGGQLGGDLPRDAPLPLPGHQLCLWDHLPSGEHHLQVRTAEDVLRLSIGLGSHQVGLREPFRLTPCRTIWQQSLEL